MSLLANANLALAVTIGATTTIIAPFVTPFLMKVIGGQFIAIDVWKMMLDIFEMMILPIIAGFIFNLFNIGKENNRSKITQMISYFIIILLANIINMKVNKIDFAGYLTETAISIGIFMILPVIAALILRAALKGDQKVIKKVLSMFSMVGIATIVIVITAAGRDSLMTVGVLLLVLVIVHNLLGYLFGYGLAWIFKMPEQDRRTIAFEVGMPNAGLASGLAMTIGNIATVGLATAIYGPLMNVTGSTLASWWRTKTPKDKKEANEPEKK
jgi:BASS family bile acid:Na+ symporter